MGRTLGELGQISSAEYALWKAAYALEPWGEWRADLRMGMLAALQANIHRAPEEEAFKIVDFMPRWNAESAAPDMDQTIQDFIQQMNKHG